MRQFIYFMREGFKILLFHRKISFLAIGVVALSLFVAGLFFLVTENLKGLESQWKEQQKVTVYLSRDVTKEQREKIRRSLSASPLTLSMKMISQEEALDNFKKTFPSLERVTQVVGENPFSPAIQVLLKVEKRGDISALRDKVSALEGVDDIQYDQQWLAKLNTFVLFLRFVGLFFGLLLGIGAVVTVTNVVRMATLVHEDEIRILWLVGATPSYIRGPFMMQGIFLGVGGGLLSIAFLAIAYHVIVAQVRDNFAIMWNFLGVSFLPLSYLAAIVAAGLICGLLGSFFTLRG